MTEILNKNSDGAQVIPAFRALNEILDMKLDTEKQIAVQTEDSIDDPRRASVLSISVQPGGSEAKVIEKVVGGILTSMKRYSSNETV